MLPTYSKQYDRENLERDADPSNPLINPSSPRTSFEAAPPVYPPSSSSSLPPSTEGRHTVEYTYSPVYPREGDTQYAVGILGRTRGETLEIVQRGILGLADIDPARISFQKKVEAQPVPHWASILDEAWEHFGNNPPSTLQVVVADLPGDKELREKHQFGICLTVTAFLLVIFGAVFGIVHLLN